MYAARRAIGAYARVGVETSVVDASPHRLIAMLFEGARAAIKQASTAMRQGDLPDKLRAFDKAISIIGQGLRASLDHERGGEIAEQLDVLYGYMLQRLALSNVTGDAALLMEVDRLLASIQDAWIAIGKSSDSPSSYVDAVSWPG